MIRMIVLRPFLVATAACAVLVLLAAAPSAGAEYSLVREARIHGARLMAPGPDGAVWVLYRRERDRRLGLKRIDRRGRVLDVELPRQRLDTYDQSNAALAAGPDGNVWLAIEGMQRTRKDRVIRLSPGGGRRTFRLPARYPVEALAAGPDGRVWYLGVGRHWIGRISTSGRISRVKVRDAYKLKQLVQGADGEMWAARRGEVIKIDRAMRVSRFSVAAPHWDAAVLLSRGPGDGIWTTGPSSLQHVSRKGALTTHPLAFPTVNSAQGPGEVYSGATRYPFSMALRADGLLGFSAAATYETRDISETISQSFGSVAGAGRLIETTPGQLPVALLNDQEYGDPLVYGDGLGRGRMITGPDGRMWVVSDGLAVRGVAIFDPDRRFRLRSASPSITSARRSARIVRVEVECAGSPGRFCNGRVALRGHGTTIARSRNYSVAAGERLRLVLGAGAGDSRSSMTVEWSVRDSVSDRRSAARRSVTAAGR